MTRRHPVLSALLVSVLLASCAQQAFAAPTRAVWSRSRPVAAAPKTLRSPESSGLADNRLIVGLKGPVTADKLSRIYRSADTSAGAIRVVRGATLSWRAPSHTNPIQFAEKLAASGEVAYASPNYLRYPSGFTPPAFVTPNDPAFTDTEARSFDRDFGLELYPRIKSWWLRNINAVDDSAGGKSAWQRGYTGPDITGEHPLRADGDAIKVAVIDTGFYFDHPDAGSNIEAGRPADATPTDPSQGPYTNPLFNTLQASHGTCVAGEIAAAAGNGIGTLGVANDTTVRVYKVYFGGLGIADEDIIDAIHLAADDGCKVINMSLGGPQTSAALQAACDYAYNKGAVIVAASGNDGVAAVSYPGACRNVLAVGAIGLKADGTTRTRSFFSNYGTKLDIMAPGEFIWGLVKPGFDVPDNSDSPSSEPGYTWWDGTSMASPIVAGGIAWLWRAMPDLTNSQIMGLVESSARDLGAAGRDDMYGWGELDMDAAYAKLVSSYPLLAKPTISYVATDNARNQRVSWTAVSGYNVRYDVAVDGTVVGSKLTGTSMLLPHDTTPGNHTVTVTPVSARNWTDDTAVASVQIAPTESVPQALTLSYYRGTLSWTDTERGTSHTHLLSIDGGAPKPVTGESWSTSDRGTYTASLVVRDNALVDSAPRTLTFTVRETPTVRRITAIDAAHYAAALSYLRKSSTTTSAVLVGSGSWTNAAIAAPLARAVDGPVLVTSASSLSASAKNEMTRLGVKNVIIVGSTASVSNAVRSALGSSRHVSRISGANRYAIANAVAREIARRQGGTLTGGRAVVVGDSVADALSASTVAARLGWPLLFSGATSVPSSTRSTLTAIGATQTLLVARTATVSDGAKAQLPNATRISAGSSAGVGTALAHWATSAYPAQFPGERFFLANPSARSSNLGLPAEAAREHALVLTTGSAIAGAVTSYYTSHSEIAVRTRVIGGSGTIANSVVSAIKKLVGAP